MEYYLFCDESGNNGSNALNKENPYYIHAGWLVRKDNTKVIRELLETYKGQNSELKSTTMLRKTSGQIKAAEIICKMISTGCIPIISILEYRFSIAMRVIETLFDPEYNDRVPREFESNFKEKKIYATLVYEYSDQILEEFFLGFKNLDISLIESALFKMIETTIDIEKVVPLLADELDKQDDIIKYYQKYSFYLEGARIDLEEVVEIWRGVKESRKNNATMSLNHPVFVTFIQTVQNLCYMNHIQLKIIHDNSKEFEEIYKESISIYGRNNENYIFQFNDNTQLISSNQFIEGIQFSGDELENCIQAADVLAGSLNKCLKKDVEKQLLNTVVPFLFANFEKGLTLCNPRISRQKLYEIVRGISNPTISRELMSYIEMNLKQVSS